MNNASGVAGRVSLLLWATFALVGLVFMAALGLWVTPAPRRRWLRTLNWPDLVAFLRREKWWMLVPVSLIPLQVLQLHFLDGPLTAWVKASYDPLSIVRAIEDDWVLKIRSIHWPPLTVAFAWFYLVLHHALVLGAPLLLYAMGRRQVAHRLMVAIAVIWLLALPGFWFFPVDNPHIANGDPLTLEGAIPGSEPIYYDLTSQDNTVPSLHTGFAALIAWYGMHAGSRRLHNTMVGYAPFLWISTLYLQVHWIIDIFAGLAAAALAIVITEAVVSRLESRVERSRHALPAHEKASP